MLAQSLLDALEELLDTTVRSVRVRQPTRKATPAARRAADKKSAARQEAAARKATGQKRAAVRNLVVGARKATSAAVGRVDESAAGTPARTSAKKTGYPAGTGQASAGEEGGSQEAAHATGRSGLGGRGRMTSLVFVPVDRAEALALRAGADLGARPAALRPRVWPPASGPPPSAEEVEFAALSHAGVLALSAGSDPLRLVLAADVADQQVTDQRERAWRGLP